MTGVVNRSFYLGFITTTEKKKICITNSSVVRDLRLQEALVILGRHLSVNTEGEPIVKHPFINSARCQKALSEGS